MMLSDFPPPPTYTDIPLAQSTDRKILQRASSTGGFENKAFDRLRTSQVHLHNIVATTSFGQQGQRVSALPGIATQQVIVNENQENDRVILLGRRLYQIFISPS